MVLRETSAVPSCVTPTPPQIVNFRIPGPGQLRKMKLLLIIQSPYDCLGIGRKCPGSSETWETRPQDASFQVTTLDRRTGGAFPGWAPAPLRPSAPRPPGASPCFIARLRPVLSTHYLNLKNLALDSCFVPPAISPDRSCCIRRRTPTHHPSVNRGDHRLCPACIPAHQDMKHANPPRFISFYLTSFHFDVSRIFESKDSNVTCYPGMPRKRLPQQRHVGSGWMVTWTRWPTARLFSRLLIL